MDYTATISFPSNVMSEAEARQLFETFQRCIAQRVPYQAVLRGPVQMNIVVVNESRQ